MGKARILMVYVWSRGQLVGHVQLLPRHGSGIFLLCYERALAFTGFAKFLIPMTTPRTRLRSSCRIAAT